MKGDSSLIHSLRRHVGIGSNLQVAFFDFKIFFISSSVQGVKSERVFKQCFSYSWGFDVDIFLSKSDLRFLILLSKSYQIYLECLVSFYIQGVDLF
jgi:hypothetical protein